MREGTQPCEMEARSFKESKKKRKRGTQKKRLAFSALMQPVYQQSKSPQMQNGEAVLCHLDMGVWWPGYLVTSSEQICVKFWEENEVMPCKPGRNVCSLAGNEHLIEKSSKTLRRKKSCLIKKYMDDVQRAQLLEEFNKRDLTASTTDIPMGVTGDFKASTTDVPVGVTGDVTASTTDVTVGVTGDFTASTTDVPVGVTGDVTASTTDVPVDVNGDVTASTTDVPVGVTGDVTASTTDVPVDVTGDFTASTTDVTVGVTGDFKASTTDVPVDVTGDVTASTTDVTVGVTGDFTASTTDVTVGVTGDFTASTTDVPVGVTRDVTASTTDVTVGVAGDVTASTTDVPVVVTGDVTASTTDVPVVVIGDVTASTTDVPVVVTGDVTASTTDVPVVVIGDVTASTTDIPVGVTVTGDFTASTSDVPVGVTGDLTASPADVSMGIAEDYIDSIIDVGVTGDFSTFITDVPMGVTGDLTDSTTDIPVGVTGDFTASTTDIPMGVTADLTASTTDIPVVVTGDFTAFTIDVPVGVTGNFTASTTDIPMGVAENFTASTTDVPVGVAEDFTASTTDVPVGVTGDFTASTTNIPVGVTEDFTASTTDVSMSVAEDFTDSTTDIPMGVAGDFKASTTDITMGVAEDFTASTTDIPMGVTGDFTASTTDVPVGVTGDFTASTTNIPVGVTEDFTASTTDVSMSVAEDFTDSTTDIPMGVAGDFKASTTDVPVGVAEDFTASTTDIPVGVAEDFTASTTDVSLSVAEDFTASTTDVSMSVAEDFTDFSTFTADVPVGVARDFTECDDVVMDSDDEALSDVFPALAGTAVINTCNDFNKQEDFTASTTDMPVGVIGDVTASTTDVPVGVTGDFTASSTDVPVGVIGDFTASTTDVPVGVTGDFTASTTDGLTDGDVTKDFPASTTDGDVTKDFTASTTDGDVTKDLPASTSDGDVTKDFTASTTDGDVTKDFTASTTDGDVTKDFTASTSDGGITKDFTASTTDGCVTGDESSGDAKNCESRFPGVKIPLYEGQMKRKYDKRQFCYFCCKSVSKMARHLEHVHSDEVEIAKIMALKDKTEKAKELERYRLMGNFKHNIDILNKGKGELVVARRPSCEKIAENYLPCCHCLAFIEDKELWRHVRDCRYNNICGDEEDDGEKSIMSKCKMLLSGAVDGFNEFNTQKFKELQTGVIDFMMKDGVTRCVVRDEVILTFGNTLLLKNGIQRKNDTSRRMRQLGRLLMELKKKHPKKQLVDFLSGCYFDDVVEATIRLCGEGDGSTMNGVEMFKTPSLGLHIGHSVAKCALIKKGMAVRKGDVTMKAEVNDFLELHSSEWTNLISSKALQTLKERQFNKEDVLPLTSDVIKLAEYVSNKVDEGTEKLLKHRDRNAWKELCRTVFVALTTFNKRRGGEVARMQLSCFTNRPQWQHNEEIQKSLTNMEKKLLQRFDLVQLPGKRNRKVPMLLKPELVKAMNCLVEHREKLNVNGPYFFGVPDRKSHINAWQVLNEFAKAAGCTQPDLVSTTKLRKYTATVTQILALTEGEMDWLSNHMGHNIEIHKHVYKQHESTIEIAKISKLLLAVEKGKLANNKGTELDKIPVDGIFSDSESEEQEDVNTNHDAGDSGADSSVQVEGIPRKRLRSSKSQDAGDLGADSFVQVEDVRRKRLRSSKSQDANNDGEEYTVSTLVTGDGTGSGDANENSDDADPDYQHEGYSSSTTDDEKENRHIKQCTRWTEKEIAFLNEYFISNIDKMRIPRNAEIKAFLQKYPSVHRSIPNIKSKVQHLINKHKKKKRST